MTQGDFLQLWGLSVLLQEGENTQAPTLKEGMAGSRQNTGSPKMWTGSPWSLWTCCLMWQRGHANAIEGSTLRTSEWAYWKHSDCHNRTQMRRPWWSHMGKTPLAIHGYEDGRRGPKPRNVVPSRSWKEQENSSLGPREGTQACWHLDFSLEDSLHTFGFQNCKIKYLCCLKSFVTAAIRN